MVGGAIDTSQEQPIKIYLDKKSTTLKFDLKNESGLQLEYGHLGCYPFDNCTTEPCPSPSLDLSNEPTKEDYTQCRKKTKEQQKKYFGMINPDSQEKGDCYVLSDSDVDKIKSLTPIDNNNCEKSFPDKILPLNYKLGSEKNIFISNINESHPNPPKYIEQFPIQRWNCITLNVHNNICDVFDGKLYHTNVFNGRPILNEDPIVIGNNGGFDGYVSIIIWSNKSLHPQEFIKNIVRDTIKNNGNNDRIKNIFSKKPPPTEKIYDSKRSPREKSRI